MARKSASPAKKVPRLKSLAIRTASIDRPISDDDSTEFGEVIGDDVLDKRERRIISERFGLEGGEPKTLENVAKNFGIKRTRICQLQNIALAKLRGALRKREDPLDPALGLA